MLPTRVLSGIYHDLILGMDCCGKWIIETRLGHGEWPNREGPRKQFATGGAGEKAAIYGVWAGTSYLSDEQREQIQKLVNSNFHHFRRIDYVNWTSIDVQEATSIMHRPRQMARGMRKAAKAKVEVMFKSWIIEISASPSSSEPGIVRNSDLDSVIKKDAYLMFHMECGQAEKSKISIKNRLKDQACI